MESIKTCELCLERIIKTENFENLNCDERQNLTILKNLEINVSRDAKICSNCVNVSHLMYNFKMSCLINSDHLKTLIHPGINDKLILEEVIVKETKSEFKNEEKVCRFCLNFSEVNSLVKVNLEQDVVLKDMLRRCLPEIDTDIVQNPLICSICSGLLKKLFDFISQWKDTDVVGNLDTKTDGVVNESKPTITVANNHNKIDESLVKEENCEGVGDPEFQIKSEDIDINEDVKNSVNDSNCILKEGELHAKPPSFSSGLIHQPTHRTTRNFTTNKLYKCTECLFQFKCETNLAMHKKNDGKTYKCNMCSFMASNKCEIAIHKKVHQNLAGSEVFKCHKCSYITKRRGSLDVHYIRWHVDISKLSKLKCNECPYETIWTSALVKHKVKHRDPSELKMYKCTKCSHQTKRKNALQRHEKIHTRNPQNIAKVKERLRNHGTINEKKFVCDICSYQTPLKRTLKQHHLTHEKLSEDNAFKCDYCPFATKWKKSLKGHTIRHKNPSELPKFKCNDCPYETVRRQQLVTHVLVHKDPSQVVKKYKCKVCPYRAKYRSNIQIHEKKHQDVIYTCDKCSYKTKLKRCFVGHLRYHEEWKQPGKSNQNLEKFRPYKCNKCSYVSARKSHLINHQIIHKDLSERETYNCTECLFQALYKITLQRHVKKNHSDLEVPFGELKSFRCNECDYETTYKRCISKHLKTHEKEKMTRSVKEKCKNKTACKIKEGP